MALTQHVLLLDLKDDPELISQYRDWHRPGRVPQAVLDSIRRSGIADMSIWLCGPRLVMILSVEPGFSFEAKGRADADDPEVQAWERLMDRFQQALPWAEPGVKWTTAEPIFALSEG